MGNLEEKVKEKLNIKNLTTFKIGGEIEHLYVPKTQAEMVELLKTLNDYIILGNCSNVLISSDGYDGNIILTTKLSGYKFNGNIVTASCGTKGQLLSQKACENSLSGFEFMIGFPGTVGGEICMNASAHGQSISDYLIRCSIYNKQTRNIELKDKSEMKFGYRKSLLQNNKYVLLDAEFNLIKKTEEEIKNLMKKNLQSRKEVQPNLANPNAGSVFRNPPNDSAGRLLDKANVKNLDGNNVGVWKKHANFIINKGNATSTDVLCLMCKMKDAVKNKFNIDLEPEIIYIGNKNKQEEELCKILYQKQPK